jgi:rRNA processing protein Gar1
MEDLESVVLDVMQKIIKKLEYIKESENVKSKNELLAEFSKLSLRAENEFLDCEMLELGTVVNYTEGFLVISSSPKAPLMELDTKVCTDDFLVIGKIDDIIGSVEKPHYSVIAFKYVRPGTEVYYPAGSPILSSLNKSKGTDASNNNDEETSEESSDDGQVKPKKVNKRQRKKNFLIFQEPAPYE